MPMSLERSRVRLARPLQVLPFLLLLLPSAFADVEPARPAIGVGPTSLDYGAIVRGEPVQREFVVQNMRDDSARVVIQPEGEMSEWLSSSAGWSWTMGARSQRTVNLTLTAPSEAAIGAYAGRARVSVHPERVRSPGEDSEVGLEVPVDLTATVGGEQTLLLRVSGVSTQDTEAGRPLRFRIAVVNEGNVRAHPRVELVVRSLEGNVVLEDVRDFGPIRPGATEELALDPENPLAPATVTATVRILLGSEPIHEESVTFDIVEAGALRRKGVLGRLIASTFASEGSLEPASVPEGAIRFREGQAATLHAPFTNTGELALEARFEGVLVRDGELIETLASDTLLVDPGESVDFSFLLEDGLPAGRYSFQGSVKYSGKVTPIAESILNVEPPVTPPLATPGPGPVLVVLALALAFALAQRRR